MVPHIMVMELDQALSTCFDKYIGAKGSLHTSSFYICNHEHKLHGKVIGLGDTCVFVF